MEARRLLLQQQRRSGRQPRKCWHVQPSRRAHYCTIPPSHRSYLAVHPIHAVPSPPRLLSPLAALHGVGLAAIPLYQHLPQERLRLLQHGRQRRQLRAGSAGSTAGAALQKHRLQGPASRMRSGTGPAGQRSALPSSLHAGLFAGGFCCCSAAPRTTSPRSASFSVSRYHRRSASATTAPSLAGCCSRPSASITTTGCGAPAAVLGTSLLVPAGAEHSVGRVA